MQNETNTKYFSIPEDMFKSAENVFRKTYP